MRIQKPGKVRRKRNNEEEQHQEALFKWLSNWSPSIRDVTFHTPNGGFRSISEARRLKRQGVTPGIPDICMLIPWNGYHGLFIELKSRNGELTQQQQLKINRLRKLGYRCEVCYSWFEAMGIIKDYLKGRPLNA